MGGGGSKCKKQKPKVLTDFYSCLKNIYFKKNKNKKKTKKTKKQTKKPKVNLDVLKDIPLLCISVYFCLYLRILSKLTLELSKNLVCAL